MSSRQKSSVPTPTIKQKSRSTTSHSQGCRYAIVIALCMATCATLVALERSFFRSSDMAIVEEWLRKTSEDARNLKFDLFETTLTNATASTSATPSRTQNNPPDMPSLLSIDGLTPRAFSSWPHHVPLPCLDPFENVRPDQNWFDRKVQKRPTKHGLLYLKLTKTASSTSSGVHLRIARNLARRRRQDIHSASIPRNATWPVCLARFLHGWAGPKMYHYGQRNQTASFLWTTLREPTARYVSEFYHFHVSRKNTPANQRTFQRFLHHGPHANHHSLDWLAVGGYQYGKTDPRETAQQILMDYDFLGTSERFDESVVVLSMLLGIPLRDVLYVSSKQSGGYDDLCFKIQKANLTKPMQKLLETPEWQEYIAPEVALYKAANASLDLTIDRLGRSLVQEQVELFQQALSAVQETCGKITKFPCTSAGERISANETDCIVGDMGCGFECIDRVADEHNLPS